LNILNDFIQKDKFPTPHDHSRLLFQFADLDGIFPTINLIQHHLIRIEELKVQLPDLESKRNQLRSQIEEMEAILKETENEDHGQKELKKAM
jgi:hypothetical protein